MRSIDIQDPCGYPLVEPSAGSASSGKPAPAGLWGCMDEKPASGRYLVVLSLGALGVVYGDIGTSPLYALRQCFTGEHALPPTPTDVLGLLSLILWSVLLIVAVKYLAVVMRATNRGEGGILALMALAFPKEALSESRRKAMLVGLGVFGAALLYGDGMITPAITVLSAMEGVEVATPALRHAVIPLTVLIVVGLFAAQNRGTGRVGAIFGPVMVVWFVAIGLLGINGIIHYPSVLRALDPVLGIKFLALNGWRGFVLLGAVFLAVTGAEALYADVGHFGVRPIRVAWFGCVMPGLFLNYLGQGALVLHDPNAIANPFYMLAPRWALYPLVGLATAAGVIASQALISGAYSLTIQAIQLGYLPRMAVKHTSSLERGQIYLPHVNWALMVACIGLVLGFESSSNMGSAYGIAVTLTMLSTTVLFYFAAQRLWGWSWWRASAFCGVFAILELSFFVANLLKVVSGGWFPLATGFVIFLLMATWKKGRQLVWQKLQPGSLPLRIFLKDLQENDQLFCRASGTALFMTANPHGTPIALLHNLKHNKVLHERNVLLTIMTDEVPQVDATKRLQVESLSCNFYRLVGHYGFMEEPNVPDLLKQAKLDGQGLDLAQTTFFLSRESIVPSSRGGMPRWRQWLFAVMARNAQPASSFYRIPPNRVVELGMQVEI